MGKVVVTGIGVVAPNGIGIDTYWRNLISGKSYIEKSDLMENLGFNSKVASTIKNFNLEEYNVKKLFPSLEKEDKFVQYGVLSGKLSLDDSLLDYKNLKKEECGVIFASAIGGTTSVAKTFEDLSDYGKSPITYKPIGPNFYNSGMFNHSASLLSKSYGFEGYCMSLSTGCTAGLDALGLGYEAIKNGEASVMLVGSSEAPHVGFTYATLDIIGSLSVAEGDPSRASRPFDKKRAGFVIGEGASFLVLENEAHAIKRGAKIYGEITSFYSLSNAHHMTDLKADGESMSEVINRALTLGEVLPSDIDYINAHGSSTPQNDLFETNAYKNVFGDRAYDIPISSTKSMIGHSLSSASLMGATSALMSIKTSKIHPTINYEFEDEQCDLNYVPNHFVEKEVNTALVTASGFGGIHSAAIFKKYGGIPL
ncbi:beta-ketoacyl-[acyl-carrier-protein] synthase family protein [Priestia sp. YIM B13546]|uniref:beta-ketoacyl-[acyl-carrier-protein] synthase family protein n=1 Tax=Priestia sp. YIM B13546 TaxID=3366302 RepID=UPI00366DD61B